MTSVLLLGANGQVGWECRRSLAVLGPVDARTRMETGGDLTQPDAVAAHIRATRPSVVVNAAAYTAVDKAESDTDTARLVNATAVGAMADACRDVGALLVHYSTDYVFSGEGDAPWAVDAPTAPLNAYGLTKWEGEEAVRASGCQHLIFRTCWVYAARGSNFAKTMLRLAGEREALSVVADQFGAPTGADLIADVTAHAIGQALRDGDSATYHLAASGVTNWHAYACFAIAYARAAGWPVKVSEEAIAAVATDAFPTPARRPGNSRLDTTSLQRRFGLTLPDWQLGVARMIDELPVPV